LDEFEKAGLTPEPSKFVKAPRIKESKVSFECKLHKHEKVYDMHLILGEALLISADDNILDEEGRVDYERYRAVGRLGGRYYLRVTPECLLKI